MEKLTAATLDTLSTSSPAEAPSKDEHPTRYSSLRTCPEVPLPATFQLLPTLTRTAIAQRIAGGELLVIHAPLVYKIPKRWLDLHPGGNLSILHYVGRDASNEIEAYHTGKTVKERMSRWIVGKIDVTSSTQPSDKYDDAETPTPSSGWRDMVPPIQLGMWPVPVPSITFSLVDSNGESGSSSPSMSPKLDDHPARRPSLVPTRPLTPSLIDPPSEPLEDLPLTPAYQQHLRDSQRALHRKIVDLGLDTPPDWLAGYAPSLAIYGGLGFLFLWLFWTATSFWGYMASAVALGGFWHQVTFVVHDAGHTGITGDWMTDRLIGGSLATCLGGLSVGWWCDNHNVHHLVTNSPEHDPDIQHFPFFAISTRFFDSIKSSYHNRILEFDAAARFLIPIQHKMYYVIMLFARFNLMVLSYLFLLTKWPARASPLFKLRLLEFVGIGVFWTWFSMVLRAMPGMGTRIMFLIVSFAVTSPLHVQIVLSHFSQPVSVSQTETHLPPSAELIESHMHRQLRTTMDISCPTYLDFLHGGLNFQTPHHLLPRIPRFRFRAVAQLVDEWVQEENRGIKDGVWRGIKLKEGEGLRYKKMEFVEANRDIVGVLKSVADQVVLLAKVAEADAKGELHHAH